MNTNLKSWYDFFQKPNGGFYKKFVTQFPEFNIKDFESYVIAKNKADRDSGELQDIAMHEILRLAHEFSEHRFKASNVYGVDWYK